MQLTENSPRMPACFHWPDFLPAFRKAAAIRGFAATVLTDTPAGPLCAWTRGAGHRHVYLSSGIHGDEPAGPLALLKLMEDDFFGSHIRWSICPALNPTGLAAGTRETATGTDLNRDYLKRSSVEAHAHATWLETRDAPELFLSLHEDWESTGFYCYEINQCEDEPARARSILEAVAPWFEPEDGVIDGHEVRQPGWIFHSTEPDLPDGWPEAIFLAKQRRCMLSFTLETPSQARLEDRIAAHCAAVDAALTAGS